MNSRELICIICPNGCHLMVYTNEQNRVIEVENALCKNGRAYSVSEIQNPERSLTTTVKVSGGVQPLVSVRSDRPIPKAKLAEAAAGLRKLELAAPIESHQLVLQNILGTGANIITTKRVLKK